MRWRGTHIRAAGSAKMHLHDLAALEVQICARDLTFETCDCDVGLVERRETIEMLGVEVVAWCSAQSLHRLAVNERELIEELVHPTDLYLEASATRLVDRVRVSLAHARPDLGL